MLKEAPDHHDVELVLKLYDLRRESVMRESRNAKNSRFWPRSAGEAVAITTSEHPLNVAFRQTSGYWEMVFGMARHGIIHADFLVENSGEGLEWVVANSIVGKVLMEGFRARVKRMVDSKT